MAPVCSVPGVGAPGVCVGGSHALGRVLQILVLQVWVPWVLLGSRSASSGHASCQVWMCWLACLVCVVSQVYMLPMCLFWVCVPGKMAHTQGPCAPQLQALRLGGS